MSPLKIDGDTCNINFAKDLPNYFLQCYYDPFPPTWVNCQSFKTIRRERRSSISAYFKDDATTIKDIAQQLAHNMGIRYD